MESCGWRVAGFSWKVVPGDTLGARLSGGYCWAYQSEVVYGAPCNLQSGKVGELHHLGIECARCVMK